MNRLEELATDLEGYLPAAIRNQANQKNGGPTGPGTLKGFRAKVAEVFQLGRCVDEEEKAKDRITWTESHYGGWDGRPGTSKLALFSISYRLISTEPMWRLSSVLPGMTKSVLKKSDDEEELKALAERLLERWAGKIGFGS